VTNAKCIAALRYKAGLGTMSDETLKKLDTVYCDTKTEPRQGTQAKYTVDSRSWRGQREELECNCRRR
jgi:hypothetical protein